MTDLEKFSKLTRESDLELLSLLLEITEQKILGYTNRSTLPSNLNQVKLEWALVAYNKLGCEGETSRSEGGISSTFQDIPDNIERILKQNRLSRVGGKTYEA